MKTKRPKESPLGPKMSPVSDGKMRSSNSPPGSHTTWNLGFRFRVSGGVFRWLFPGFFTMGFFCVSFGRVWLIFCCGLFRVSLRWRWMIHWFFNQKYSRCSFLLLLVKVNRVFHRGGKKRHGFYPKKKTPKKVRLELEKKWPSVQS